MTIDIIFIVFIILAIIQGYRRGLIVAAFSVIALFIGLAAALKLSVVTAGYIGQAVKISDRWLPFIAFAVIFLIVILLVRWVAILLQKSVEIAMLGWLNRLGGILLYVTLFIIVFSVLIFFAEKIQWIKPDTKNDSLVYPYIQPLGMQVMEAFGKVIPLFKGMFHQLEEFFDSVSHQVPPAR